jgi:hypothetical protein
MNIAKASKLMAALPFRIWDQYRQVVEFLEID